MPSSMDWFQGRKIIIATKHQKELVLSPLLEKELNLKCHVPDDYDTDLLGTFTGEIERINDPVTTLRKKCLGAMDKYGFDLGIASEGSFGMHPTLFFSQADDELLMLIDKKNNLEIISRVLTTNTNFNGSFINSIDELKEFTVKTLFPSHGLIIRNNKDDDKKIIKGIVECDILESAFKETFDEFGIAYVETDMRALFNPTRMKTIEQAAEKLISKITSQCPQCKTPGFDITEIKSGLTCSQCGNLTRSTYSHVYSCKKCNHSEEKLFPLNKTEEDPMFCDYCNP